MAMTHCLCCDDMSLLFFVESSDTFDRHVVRLRGSRCEDNVFCIGPNHVRDVLWDDADGETLISGKRNTVVNTLRASSTAFSASQPYACVRLWGFPY